jgi:hypothetical protein
MEYEDFKQSLQQFEAEFELDNVQSLNNMVNLYLDLYTTNYHDLLDSIELWISQYGNEEIKNYIQQKNDNKLNGLLVLIPEAE